MSKSDKKAKDAYIVHLKSNGYENVKVINSPVDISAEKNGENYYFEIKMTKKKTKYFGAATLTEWVQAFKTPLFVDVSAAHPEPQIKGIFIL